MRWLCRALSGWARVGEAVPDARHGEDVVGPRRLRLDLPPQVADVDVDDPRLDWILVAPDRVEDLLAAENLARIAGQERQQVELSVGQLDFLPASIDAALVDVDEQVAKLQTIARRLRRLHSRAAKMGRDPRRQLAKAERLDDIVVGPDLERDERELIMITGTTVSFLRSSRQMSKPEASGSATSRRTRLGRTDST